MRSIKFHFHTLLPPLAVPVLPPVCREKGGGQQRAVVATIGHKEKTQGDIEVEGVWSLGPRLPWRTWMKIAK